MAAPPPTLPPPRTSAAPELRRHLLFLVLSVVALDAGAVLLQRAVGFDAWPERRQQLFTAGWVAATLVVVGIFLSRVRATRVRARRARAAGGR